MALYLIANGFHNKHFIRDFFIDPVTLGRRSHESLTVVEFVFNWNALEINGMGEGVYFIKLNSNADKRMVTQLLKQSLINGEGEEEYKFVNSDDQQYQNLFMGWQGFMF